jgi:hypothetical protein
MLKFITALLTICLCTHDRQIIKNQTAQTTYRIINSSTLSPNVQRTRTDVNSRNLHKNSTYLTRGGLCDHGVTSGG